MMVYVRIVAILSCCVVSFFPLCLRSYYHLNVHRILHHSWILLCFSLEELPSKLRGLVRSTKKVEADIAALKISYLKKINKGSNIVIMDSWVLIPFLSHYPNALQNLVLKLTFSNLWMLSYCDSAKIVAKTLTSFGFNNCSVVADGFSGSRGWLQSRLGTDTYNFSLVEVLSPSQVIPAAAKRFGTTSTKFLPGAE